MYSDTETEASKSALLELGINLKRYKDDMVLAGGWAPYFISNKFFPHCGSIDIDFVLKTEIMEKYESIQKTVQDLGYTRENEFRFSKDVISPVDKKDYSIHVDFLCDKEGLKYTNIRNIQGDLGAFAFEGSNIAFDFNFEEEVATVIPKNGKDKVKVRVVDLIGSLVLKGKAMDGRSKAKDFYDVYSLTFFNGSWQKAAEYMNRRIEDKQLIPERSELLKHSLSVLREKFEDEESVGPYQVEDFTNGKILRREVFNRVDSFLKIIMVD